MGRSRKVVREVSRAGPCALLQTPPHHWWGCISHRCSNCLSVLCWQQPFHHRSRERHGPWGCCFLLLQTSSQAPGTKALLDALCLDVTQPEQPSAAKEMFDMAQLLKGLIFPSYPITSLGIKGFCSPQQLSRQGLHTAFLYHCVLISTAAKPPNESSVATVPYSQDCSFLPSFTLMVPAHRNSFQITKKLCIKSSAIRILLCILEKPRLV